MPEFDLDAALGGGPPEFPLDQVQRAMLGCKENLYGYNCKVEADSGRYYAWVQLKNRDRREHRGRKQPWQKVAVYMERRASWLLLML